MKKRNVSIYIDEDLYNLLEKCGQRSNIINDILRIYFFETENIQIQIKKHLSAAEALKGVVEKFDDTKNEDFDKLSIELAGDLNNVKKIIEKANKEEKERLIMVWSNILSKKIKKFITPNLLKRLLGIKNG